LDRARARNGATTRVEPSARHPRRNTPSTDCGAVMGDGPFRRPDKMTPPLHPLRRPATVRAAEIPSTAATGARVASENPPNRCRAGGAGRPRRKIRLRGRAGSKWRVRGDVAGTIRDRAQQRGAGRKVRGDVRATVQGCCRLKVPQKVDFSKSRSRRGSFS
jgi:hypothetical protein